MLTGIEEAHCNVAIQAALLANFHLGEHPATELLLPAEGKADTLTLDAIPENEIGQAILGFQPETIFLTEETSQWRKMSIPSDIALQPVIFASDPMDGSDLLASFLAKLEPSLQKRKFREVITHPEVMEQWQEHVGKTAKATDISGVTCGVSAVRKGVPFVSVIVNYMTQHLFVATRAGNVMLGTTNSPLPRSMTLSDVLSEGEPVRFNFRREWNNPESYDNYRKFVTYLDKPIYLENLQKMGAFIGELQEHSIRGIPWGPSRVLYLSHLYREHDVGFIMANGEKITEWIHWLPYIAGAQREGQPLRLFELFSENPKTRGGILMATSAPYSVFVQEGRESRHVIDIAKVRDYPTPNHYRSTLLMTFWANEWAVGAMRRHGYREIKFSI